MEKYLAKYVITAVLLFGISACGKEDRSAGQPVDPYTANLRNNLSQIEAVADALPPLAQIMEPAIIKTLPGDSLLVVTDAADNSVALLNGQGDVLSKAGGKGRGPGEFLNIAQLSIGYDGKIYLLDMVLFKITVYEVIDNQLRYAASFSYKNPPTYSLHSIYVTHYGNYGVYNQTEGFQTPANRFLFYRLNKDFKPVKQILEMPGNRRQKVNDGSTTLYLPSNFLPKTLWVVDGDWFYFITSFQATITKYNLKTEEQQQLSLPVFKKRPNSNSYKEFIKRTYTIDNNNRALKLLERENTLPLFSGFWVLDNTIILRMFFPAEKNGMMIYIRQNPTKPVYFTVPHELSQLTGSANKIFGIDFNRKGNAQLVAITLTIK